MINSENAHGKITFQKMGTLASSDLWRAILFSYWINFILLVQFNNLHNWLWSGQKRIMD